MRMFAFIAGLFLLLLQPIAAAAQCTACPNPPDVGVKVDYCTNHPKVADRCVLFSQESSNFFLCDTKGKYLAFAYPKGRTPIDFLAVYDQSKQKLRADEILLIQYAVAKWDSAKKYMGYTVTSSGLGYRITTKGTGKLPEKGKKVKVHYKGYLEDGKVFDSSFDRGTPFDFTLGVGQVIKGWDEGIALFPVGSKGTLMIPPAIGYGAAGAGGVIPPNATLFFDIEVVGAD